MADREPHEAQFKAPIHAPSAVIGGGGPYIAGNKDGRNAQDRSPGVGGTGAAHKKSGTNLLVENGNGSS
jgi:hypothetical protein